MSFVPAATEFAGAAAEPANTAFLVHGIMGSQSNWRGFARRLVERFPRWRFVLTDMRHHGESGRAPGPNDLASCAADLERLVPIHGQPRVLIGHSFGGKVVLTHARDFAEDVETVWVLDCPTGPEEDPAATEVGRLLDLLDEVELPVLRRQQAMRFLEGRGLSANLSGWMATNLRPVDGGGFRWHFDIEGVRELLDDYWTADLHPFLESGRRPPAIHVLQALRSDRWRPAELSFLEAQDGAGRLRLHRLPDAGHWCHIDAPEALAETLALTFDAR